MILDAMINRMEPFPAVVRAICAGIDAADAKWRPDEDRWSIVEIVAHLADEETEDFRARVERTLRDPSETWPGIDPEAWAAQRHYRDRDLTAEVDRFGAERARSIEWLRGLDAPNWDSTHRHPKLGPMRAGDIMAAWAAHDALHLRQLAKRLYELTRRDADTFGTAYAGDWTA